MITKDATTIDDLAGSITALGTMMGNQLTGLENSLKQDFRREIKQAIEASEKRLTAKISGLQTETSSLKSEIAGLRREQRVTNERLNSLENESKAVRNDIKEIYDRLVRIEKRLDKVEKRLGGVEKRLDKVAPMNYLSMRLEVNDIKAWARKASAKAGLPQPKF
jgi:chromosome segregation ATPase